MFRKKLILTVFTALSLFFVSCQTVSYVVHTIKLTEQGVGVNMNTDSTLHFAYQNSQIKFLGTLDGVKDTLIFDSGVGSLSVDFVNPDEAKGMKFYKTKLITSEKSKAKMTSVRSEFASPICSASGVGIKVLNKGGESKCDKELGLDDVKLIGQTGFFSGCLELNFSSHVMRFVNSEQIDKSYSPVKCEFLAQSIAFVYVTVDGVEYKCLFDTGNQMGLLLDNSDRLKNPKDTDVEYEGSYAMTASGFSSKQHFILAEAQTIGFNGQMYLEDIMYVPNLSFNNMGIRFISRFDWIIDARNGKIYARPRNVGYQTIPFSSPCRLTTNGMQLLIVNKVKGLQFNVGDIIKSVNGEEITEENICHYYELLRETKDWSAFDIQVK